MVRRRPLLQALVTLSAAAACATPTGPLPNAQQLLVAAENYVAADRWNAALEQLWQIDGELCPKRLRDRRDLALARAEMGRGQPWRAFLALEKFSDLYPHSDLRTQAVELLWRIGTTLVESDGGFLFFWSDRRAGRTVLEHLVTRHPDTQRLADALRILGDMAFDDGDYELAQTRFRDIILERPESEWKFYAQFRFAMSIVASLQGPDYDLDRMEHAVRELRGFLANDPSNPQMVAETQRALALLLDWQVRRHLDIAEFYRTVGSAEGERHHLELATRDEFADVPAYRRALDARDRFLQRAPDDRQLAAPGGGQP